MKAGTIIRTFTAKDGREVTIRTPNWSDLDAFLGIINSLVEEGADIFTDKKITRENEIDWLAGHLSAMEKDQKIALVAEVEGRVVGQVDVQPKNGLQKHVGILGIVVQSGFRDVGIGAQLMKEAETEAIRLGLRVLALSLFSSNDRAFHVYEKAGYYVAGRIPKAILKSGEYVDELVMTRELPRPP